MKPILISIILATFLAIGSNSTSIAQTPEQLYQKGLTKEVGEGALQEAISLYNQVADNSNASISLRAKALMHIGMCYEKLGMNEAKKAYQRLLASFPTQKNEVAYARERLSSLIQIADKITEAPLTPKFTKIKIPTKLSWNVALSPEGRNLALVSESKLWVMPLSGNIGPGFPGQPVHLNTEEIEVEWSGLAWSGDGKWIAFNENIAEKNQAEKPEKEKPEKEKYNQGIYIIPSSGGKPKKVIENYRDARVVNYRISLSPDGKNLAYSSVENNEQHIYTTQVDGSSPKKLIDIQSREPSFSPDGKMIAYVEDKGLGRGEGGLGLWIISAHGGTPHLVADAGKASSPVWSPDGKMIAYLDYLKNKQINLVEVPDDLQGTGRVTSIDAPAGTEEVTLLAGWTHENKIGVLLRSKLEFDLYTLPATGGQAAMVLHDCNAYQPRWSKDGKQIFYVMYPDEQGENKFYKGFLASIPANGGTGKPLPKNNEGKEIGQLPFQSGNRISPDGKSFITSAYTSADSGGLVEWPNSKIWKIALDGNESEQITNKQGPYADWSPCWSPDGEKVAFIRVQLLKGVIDPYGDAEIYIINSSGGEPKLLASTTNKWIISLIWSPDGNMIAYLSQGKEAPYAKALNIIDVRNGVTRIAGEVPAVNVNIEMGWSPDSKRIAFNDGESKVIKIMNLDNGSIKDIETGLVDVKIYHLDWSPDGERFVFGGWKGGDAEFWFMEDFLPLEKLAQIKRKEDLSIRKALANTDVEPLGTPSPDGRYISFVDWNSGGNICILDLETNEKRQLTDFKDPYEQSYYSSWSPDGKNIAYFWWDKAGSNLSIVDIKESKSRVLLKSDKIDWIELGNWSSDGKYIVTFITLRGKPESQIARISTSDGSVQVFKTFDKPHGRGKPYFSPDSRYVAYDLPEDNTSGNSDIYIYSVEDQQENVLFKYPGMDYILGWTPDGKNILFATDRKGTVDAMIIGVEKGKSIGQPKSVIQNIGPVTPMGFTQKGTFYYGQWPEMQNIYTAEIDFENGKILTQPTIAVRRFEGKNRAPSYSNDGKYLAYISDHGLYRKGNAGNVLCIHDLKTGEESEIMPDAKMTKPIRSWLQWSPDNLSIALMSFNEEGYTRIYNYDIQTKKFTPIAPGSDDHLSDTHYVYPLWSKDGKFLYYLQISKNSQSSQIMVLNIATGDENELYRYSSDNFYDRIFTLSLSPDGKWLSAINIGENKFVRLISTIDGKTRDLYTCKTIGTSEYDQVWSRDGRYIIITYPKQLENGGNEWNLMRMPFEGGENLSIKINMMGMFNPTLHPDGRTLSFESTGYSKAENSIWAIENLVPKE